MSKVFRYTRWDGSQVVDLEFKTMTDDFLEKFLETGDASFALEWMLREGLSFDSQNFRLEGLDRLAKRLSEQRGQMLKQFNPKGLSEELRKRLDQIVQKELKAVQQAEEQASQELSVTGSGEARKKIEELFQREAGLHGLPQNLGEAVRQLRKYDFLDKEAEAEFQEFLKTLSQLQQMAAQNMSQGGQPMTLEQAMALAEQLRRLDELIQALERGDLQGMNLEDLARYLGEEASRSIQTFLQFMNFLRESGFVAVEEGRLVLTPKAMRLIAQKALRDIYSMVGRGAFGAHSTSFHGPGEALPDESRPFAFGDPFQLHLPKTLSNAVFREAGSGLKAEALRSGKSRVRLKPEDFEVFKTEFNTSTATVLMLDMSYSMFQNDRFTAAKKVALALEHLIRTRYPTDKFYMVGFATQAHRLNRKQLLEAVGSFGDDVFTNIQDGLRMAHRLLGQHPDARHQVIMITDGQPTAFTMNGQLHIEWPTFGISPTAIRETLKEVRAFTRSGATINTFMLDRSPMLVSFVNEVTKINKGRAFFTAPNQLGKYLLVDYLSRKKRSVH
jgi:uncharacterized protein with von Willebrand factor type A (vWA) domain